MTARVECCSCGRPVPDSVIARVVARALPQQLWILREAIGYGL